MNEIIKLLTIFERMTVEEIDQSRKEFIAEYGDSTNHIIDRLVDASIRIKLGLPVNVQEVEA